MLEFATVLPTLRRHVRRDLKRPGLAERRILACGVRLLDLGFMRIGSERYAEENETYGLATLRRRHVSFDQGAVLLDYRAKGAQRELRRVTDPEVVRAIRSLKRRRGGGYGLLAYRTAGGEWSEVRSDQINAYVKEHAGEGFSAKDFRTWNATVLAAVHLSGRNDTGRQSESARKRAIRGAVEQVADYLGNTPAVCRSSYIDPRVFDRFRNGESIRVTITDPAELTNGAVARRERIEAAVVRLLS